MRGMGQGSACGAATGLPAASTATIPGGATDGTPTRRTQEVLRHMQSLLYRSLYRLLEMDDALTAVPRRRVRPPPL